MFDLTMGPSSMISAALCVLLVLLFLLVWFVVNRASVRANQQVHLLEEIAEYQRRQTELLAKLVAQGKVSDPQDAIEEDSALSLKGFIPER
ncbi:YebO family protein [Rouxiella sp. Mn2063]|uniref:YebO family protein n=1 Tax=Rouxiella sp. Mn2063 TaxID=3395262 RepID=UPI003BE8AED6